jgi:hypothetical protein
MERLLKISATKVVREKPRQYLFTLADLSDAKRALEADGKSLTGTPHRLSVRQVRRQLTIEEIFEHLRFRLESRDRADMHFKNSNSDRSRSPQRNVRVAESEDEKKGGGKSSKKDGKKNSSRSLSPSRAEDKTPAPQAAQ